MNLFTPPKHARPPWHLQTNAQWRRHRFSPTIKNYSSGEQQRSDNQINNMPNPTKKSEVQVSQSQGEVVAVGPQSAEKEYPTTIRTAEGDYLKVWHGESLRRGTAITVDEVIWENGWKDTFIVTC
tara:strand:- start:272 stop:646 length:375 start_codon:yes stop_codon:yes gene_type:complete